MEAPAADLRVNIGTWTVLQDRLPAVAVQMQSLPTEEFDPSFLGQTISTTYYDSPCFDLRKARLATDRYLTLRTRCYLAVGKVDAYALSAKTEDQKFRRLLSPAEMDAIRYVPARLLECLPADLLSRAQELLGDEDLVPVVTVSCQRYACETATERYTLDIGTKTDSGKCLEAAILEYKNTPGDATAPSWTRSLGLRPIKLSKFLWATDWR